MAMLGFTGAVDGFRSRVLPQPSQLATDHWPLLPPVGVALLGFIGAVDGLYPLLGGACFLMLTAKAIDGLSLTGTTGH